MIDTEPLETKIKRLKNISWGVWSEIHNIVREHGFDDKIFFEFPIKTPTIEIIDNLDSIEVFLKEKKEKEKDLLEL